jgi:predicted PurR-regulated permease PerM
MQSSRLQLFFLIAILLGSFLLAFYIFEPFLGALALASIFAVVLQPLYQRLLTLTPNWPSVAATLTLIICLVCILVPLSFLVMQIAGETQALYGTLTGGGGASFLSSVVNTIQEFIRAHVPGMEHYSIDVSTTVSTYAREGLAWLLAHLLDAFSSVTNIFLNLLVFFFALYFLLRDGDSLIKTVSELSPLDDEDDRAVFSRLTLAINSIIRGNLTIALIQGVQAGVGLSLFGVPNPVVWGAFAGVASLVPGIGTALVFVPAVVYLFAIQNVPATIGLVIWWLIAVTLIDNNLAPRFVGHGAGLHPLVVLLSVLGGVTFFGPMGVFFGPLCLCFLLALLSVYSKPPKAPVTIRKIRATKPKSSSAAS